MKSPEGLVARVRKGNFGKRREHPCSRLWASLRGYFLVLSLLSAVDHVYGNSLTSGPRPIHIDSSYPEQVM